MQLSEWTFALPLQKKKSLEKHLKIAQEGANDASFDNYGHSKVLIYEISSLSQIQNGPQLTSELRILDVIRCVRSWSRGQEERNRNLNNAVSIWLFVV